ncbi:MAG: leucine-rich repeat protein [Lachnospiraceae bacterium]|nr:leucine-rich repeat protein [Lachnospiraceae bacterium]
MKKVLAGLLAVAMLFTSIDLSALNVYAVEAEEITESSIDNTTVMDESNDESENVQEPTIDSSEEDESGNMQELTVDPSEEVDGKDVSEEEGVTRDNNENDKQIEITEIENESENNDQEIAYNDITLLGESYTYKPYDGATYELTYEVQEDNTIMISGCFGTIKGKLVIPSKINGKTVTSIGDGAFDSCSGFTGNLTIPGSVETIGDGAFDHCSGFTGNLTIPGSVETIGERAFVGCSGFTGSLTI